MTQEEETRTKLLIDLTEIGWWDFAPGAEILDWSARAKSFFGLGPEAKVTYELFLAGLHPEDREASHYRLKQALSDPGGGGYDMVFRTIGLEDQIERWINAKGYILFDDENRPVRLVGASRDITQLVMHENELKKAKGAAEAANIAKSQFLTNMNHEMRTPLAAMLGYTDLALEPDQSQSDREFYLNSIRRNGEHLLNLVDEILDLARLEARDIGVENVRVPTIDFLNEMYSALQSQAQAKGLRLEFRSDGVIPAEIFTDPVRLRQILVNLVGNALKFTLEGEVRLVARVLGSPVENGPIRLQIEIQDTGIGISEDQQQRIFKQFSQVDNSMTRRFGGSGLGLDLSKKLAQALGGELILKQSAPGVGSTFVLEFTVGPYQKNIRFVEFKKESADCDLSPSQPEQQSLSLEGLSLLVVDDSADNRLLISRYLERAGAKVDHAGDGVAAIDRIHERDYDLILMDLQMPVLDGYAATDRLRRQGYHKPIIALTANSRGEGRQRCLELGFDDHLTKPIKAKVLIQEVSNRINKQMFDPPLGFHRRGPGGVTAHDELSSTRTTH